MQEYETCQRIGIYKKIAAHSEAENADIRQQKKKKKIPQTYRMLSVGNSRE